MSQRQPETPIHHEVGIPHKFHFVNNSSKKYIDNIAFVKYIVYKENNLDAK